MNILRITLIALFSFIVAGGAVARPHRVGAACAGTDVMRPCGANSLDLATTVAPEFRFPKVCEPGASTVAPVPAVTSTEALVAVPPPVFRIVGLS